MDELPLEPRESPFELLEAPERAEPPRVEAVGRRDPEAAGGAFFVVSRCARILSSTRRACEESGAERPLRDLTPGRADSLVPVGRSRRVGRSLSPEFRSRVVSGRVVSGLRVESASPALSPVSLVIRRTLVPERESSSRVLEPLSVRDRLRRELETPSFPVWLRLELDPDRSRERVETPFASRVRERELPLVERTPRALLSSVLRLVAVRVVKRRPSDSPESGRRRSLCAAIFVCWISRSRASESF